ncbi:hypothetical protein BH18THE2_BH18THE2_30280 [soil metagenome]
MHVCQLRLKKQKNTKAARSKRRTFQPRKPKKTTAVKKVSRTSKKTTRGSGKRRLRKVRYKSITTTVVEGNMSLPSAIEDEGLSLPSVESAQSPVIDAPPINIPPPEEELSNVTGSDYRITETTVTQTELETGAAVPIDIPYQPGETQPEYRKHRQSESEAQTSEEQASNS